MLGDNDTSLALISRGPNRILYIPTEFLTWDRAKHLSYATFLGLEEVLSASNCELTTIPCLISQSPGESDQVQNGHWLNSLRALIEGKKFDQIWVEITHSSFTNEDLEYLLELAPIRIALIFESMAYSPQVTATFPHLGARKNIILNRLKAFTHAFVSDEKDAAVLNGEGSIAALWFPPSIPGKYIGKNEIESGTGRAIYSYSSDLDLSPWVQKSEFAGKMFIQKGMDIDVNLEAHFNGINKAVDENVSPGKAKWPQLNTYLDSLRAIRRKNFELELEQLARGSCIVNLPSYLQAYGISFFNAIAALRPVVSWEIPHRPRNRSLFLEGEDILTFSAHEPNTLLEKMETLKANPKLGSQLVRNAVRKLWRFHTTEIRIAQALHWIDSGNKPSFEEMDFAPSVGVSMEIFNKTFSLSKSDVSVSNISSLSGSSGHLKKSDIDTYYEKFFLQSPEYASQNPNIEEQVRWNKIEVFLKKTLNERIALGKGKLRILDLGCGRGWLTNQASKYGYAEGMEPVAPVIAGARKLFPNLTFYACEAAQLRQSPEFKPYDLILNSEVIEHVPWSHKESFIDALKSLLTPDGVVILTTPRGEVFQEYMRLVNNHGQPIEDWTTEEQTQSLFSRRGFMSEGPERIWARFPECIYFETPTPEQIKMQNLMSIYQIWRFRLG